MLATIKALSIGGLISLQILGNPGVTTDTKVSIDNQTKIEVQDYLIDELIDECDLEDADEFVDYKFSDYLKGIF